MGERDEKLEALLGEYVAECIADSFGDNNDHETAHKTFLAYIRAHYVPLRELENKLNALGYLCYEEWAADRIELEEGGRFVRAKMEALGVKDEHYK